MKSGNLEKFNSTADTARANRSAIAVYAVTCSYTGKSYIGWSTDVYARLSWHRSHLRNGKHSRREMQADFTSYGEATFVFKILTEFTNEMDAVREEAVRIGENFRAGLTYNGIVPNAAEARPRAKKTDGSRKPATHRSFAPPAGAYPLDDGVWDVMYFLGFRNEVQFLRLIDAFLKLTGKTEEALSLEVIRYPRFILALRRGTTSGFSMEKARKFHDYILHFMHERDRLQMQAERSARKSALESRRTAA